MVAEVVVVVQLDQEELQLNQLNQEIQEHLLLQIQEVMLLVQVCKLEAVVVLVVQELME